MSGHLTGGLGQAVERGASGDQDRRQKYRSARDGHDAGVGHAAKTDTLLGDGTGGLAEAYMLHGGAVYGMARQVAGAAEAENVTAEAFLELGRAGRNVCGDAASLRASLLAFAHRKAVHVLRSDPERRSRLATMTAIDVEEESSARAAGNASDVLSTLSLAERRVIVLAYFGGHNYREIAATLGQSDEEVKTLVGNGIARLRAIGEPGGTTRTLRARKWR